MNSSDNLNPANVAITVALFVCVVIGGMFATSGAIKESVSIVSTVVSLVSEKTEHWKSTEEIVAPTHIQDAVDAGHKVVGGDEKKTFVRVHGRVFAYDKSSGKLLT